MVPEFGAEIRILTENRWCFERLWFLGALDSFLAHDEDEDEYSEGEGCEADRHGDCDVEVESMEQLVVEIRRQDHQRARDHDHYAS